MPTLSLNNPNVVKLIQALELDGYKVGRWDTNDFDGDSVFRTHGNLLKELCENGIANQYASDATVKLILNMLGAPPVVRRVLNKVETGVLMRSEGIVE